MTLVFSIGILSLLFFPKTIVDVFALVLESGGGKLSFHNEKNSQDGSLMITCMPSRYEITQLTFTGEWSTPMINEKFEAPKTIEQRILEAAVPGEAIRFAVTAYTLGNADREVKSDDFSMVNVGDNSGGIANKVSILWRANFEEFIRNLWHKPALPPSPPQFQIEPRRLFHQRISRSGSNPSPDLVATPSSQTRFVATFICYLFCSAIADLSPSQHHTSVACTATGCTAGFWCCCRHRSACSLWPPCEVGFDNTTPAASRTSSSFGSSGNDIGFKTHLSSINVCFTSPT
ncbi:uncharacterized protein DS421_7g215620 [Arachis hypogaea]|nr:uncharacterized protein DS421_7g215620 [Arachis hypogaea]